MKDAVEQLATIGFATTQRQRACWRTVRLDRPVPPADGAAAGPEPACSRDLLHWRELLARRPLPPSYRISRA